MNKAIIDPDTLFFLVTYGSDYEDMILGRYIDFHDIIYLRPAPYTDITGSKNRIVEILPWHEVPEKIRKAILTNRLRVLQQLQREGKYIPIAKDDSARFTREQMIAFAGFYKGYVEDMNRPWGERRSIFEVWNEAGRPECYICPPDGYVPPSPTNTKES